MQTHPRGNFSDLEEWKQWLNTWGLVYRTDEESGTNTLFVYADDGPMQIGYDGFALAIMFDADGRFSKIGIFE